VSPEVLELPRVEWRRAAEVEGQVYRESPMFRAAFPDEHAREVFSRYGVECAIRTALLGGKTVDTTGSRAAFMVWSPPGYREPPGLVLRVPGSLFPLLRGVPLAQLRRFLAYEASLAARRHELMPEPHWYAEMLVVEPSRQRSGLGALLTRHGVARADASGAPVFLETAYGQSNVALYQKLGFELIEHDRDNPLDIPIWRMVHRPDPSASS